MWNNAVRCNVKREKQTVCSCWHLLVSLLEYWHQYFAHKLLILDLCNDAFANTQVTHRRMIKRFYERPSGKTFRIIIFWVTDFTTNTNCSDLILSAISLLCNITHTSQFTSDKPFHSLLLSVRVLCCQPSWHNFLHLAIVFWRVRIIAKNDY